MAGADTEGVCPRVRPPFMPAEPVLHALRRGSCALLAGLMSLAAPASAQPAAGAEPLDLKFGSFFRQPVGPRGLEFGEALRAADGRRVRLAETLDSMHWRLLAVADEIEKVHFARPVTARALDDPWDAGDEEVAP